MSTFGAIATIIAILNLPLQPVKAMRSVIYNKTVNGVSCETLLLAVITDAALLNYSVYHGYVWTAAISVIGFIARSVSYMLSAWFSKRTAVYSLIHTTVWLVVTAAMIAPALSVTIQPNICGAINVLASSLAFAPQFILLLTCKHSDDINSLSRAQYVLWSCSNSCWLVYAVTIGSYVVGIPAMMRLTLSMAILVKCVLIMFNSSRLTRSDEFQQTL